MEWLSRTLPQNPWFDLRQMRERVRWKDEASPDRPPQRRQSPEQPSQWIKLGKPVCLLPRRRTQPGTFRKIFVRRKIINWSLCVLYASALRILSWTKLASNLLTSTKHFLKNPKKTLDNIFESCIEWSAPHVLNKVQHPHVGAHALGDGDLADTSF